MKYIIKGTYPHYTITGYENDGRMTFIDRATDMRQIMLRFVHRFEQGDSIHYPEPGTDTEPTAPAWWREMDGAMPQ